MITRQETEEIKNKIVELENPKKIILFGSYAKNTATETSDLDLLVIKETEQPPHKRGLETRWYLGSLPFQTDLLIKTPQEFKKWQDVNISFNAILQRESKVLYEQTV